MISLHIDTLAHGIAESEKVSIISPGASETTNNSSLDFSKSSDSGENLASTDAYRTSIDHLLANLERIDLLIRGAVAQFRERTKSDGQFRGFVITEAEIDRLLTAPIGMPSWAKYEDGERPEYRNSVIEAIWSDIVGREKKSIEQGIALRLPILARTLCLNPFDVDAILICLLPEIDARYERLFAYLHDDLTKKQPSIGLISNLLCDSLEERLKTRRYFEANAPLICHGLVTVLDDTENTSVTFSSRRLRIEDRVTSYLLGSDEPDSRLISMIRIVPALHAGSLVTSMSCRTICLPGTDLLLKFLREPAGSKVIYLFGPRFAAKLPLVENVASDLGLPLLVVDVKRAAATRIDPVLFARLVCREAVMQGALLYVQHGDALSGNEHRCYVERLLESVVNVARPALFAGGCRWEELLYDEIESVVAIELPSLSRSEQEQLWRLFLQQEGNLDIDVSPEEIAAHIQLAPDRIRSVVGGVKTIVHGREPEKRRATLIDFERASRSHVSGQPGLQVLAVKQAASWNDIVLPPEKLNHLAEIFSAAKNRALVFNEWGFGEKLKSSVPLTALFTGPSGTGKSLAATILASELGLPLYKIDLAEVVSKYIGETEKNLSRIFGAAEEANALLFFDEADALFARRTEIRGSNERYANNETGHLLQLLDQYEGLAILATNLRNNMDTAFTRRMMFTVSFATPDINERCKIWRRVWPQKTPLAPDLDLDFMASQFEFTGGNIRNIALGASFYAAAAEVPVGMHEIIAATRRELHKLGRSCASREFGRYAALVETSDLVLDVETQAQECTKGDVPADPA